MKLNHLDLQLPDVPAFTAFLVDHFDLQPLTRRDSPKLAILTDGHGFTLVLQRQEPAPAGSTDATEPTDAAIFGHIGFLLDTPDAVHVQHARLTAAGVEVSPVDVNARGTRCYLRAHGVLIEVGCNAGSRVAVV